jgi:hypothetical protein
MIPDTTWEEDIPLPFSVIRRYLTENQLKSYMEWKAKYKKGYVIQYVQTLGVF